MTTFRHLVLGATISSGVAIIGSLLVAFSLVNEINVFRDDVLSDLSHFKVTNQRLRSKKLVIQMDLNLIRPLYYEVI